MGAIGGIYNFDGAPVEERLLALMRQTLTIRGPDGGGEFKSGSLGVVYRAFHARRESAVETQPFLSTQGHVLCWDGRLDNRDELESKLALGKQQTDVALVMAAYLKWGIALGSFIIGDFALSIWDPITNSLVLSRDPIGARLLYYHSNHLRVTWSTDLSLLLDLATIPLERNEEYIADSLTQLPEPGQTPYKNIHAVLPAHTVIAKPGSLQLHRFWSLRPQYEIRYRSDADYEEHFELLLRDAVRCRLKANGPVWAELSGGLDSSAIVCMANDISKRESGYSSGVTTVSRVFDEALKSDERTYIRAVENRIGKVGVHLREDDYRMFAPVGEHYSRTIPNPIADFAEYYRALDQAMQNSGARVLLSGNGGDEVLGEVLDPAPEFVSLLTTCRLWSLHRSLKLWSAALHKSYGQLAWQKTLLPLIPRKLNPRPKRSPETQFFFKLYNQDFIKRMNLSERLLGPENVWVPRPFRNEGRSPRFLRTVRLLSAGYYREFTNVEITYPYMHRPLLEFLAAIPSEQKTRPWETRSILRRSLAHLLPPEIAQRKSKGLIVYAYLKAAARESQRLFQLFLHPRVCEYGYVNRHGLMEVLENANEGRDRKCLYLVYLVALEYWLRALERRRSPVQI